MKGDGIGQDEMGALQFRFSGWCWIAFLLIDGIVSKLTTTAAVCSIRFVDVLRGGIQAGFREQVGCCTRLVG